MAKSKVYIGIIQHLYDKSFEVDKGKAVFIKWFDEAGEVFEAFKSVLDFSDSFKKNKASEHLKTKVADLSMCAVDCCAAMGINYATSVIRDCEQRQIEQGRISPGGVDEC